MGKKNQDFQINDDELFKDDDELQDKNDADDADNETNDNDNVELETIQLVYDGSVAKELKLPKELAEALKHTDSWKEMNRLMHAGLLWDKRQHEYGELKRQVETLNSLFQKAKEDDEALHQLRAHIEAAIGRPLTAKEKRELEDDVNVEDDLFDSPVVKKLQEEIQQLKKQQEELLLAEEIKRMEAEIKSLELKYDGKNGLPKFNRDEVLNFAVEKGIADLELAYKMVNFDRLTQSAKQKVKEEIKEREQKLKDATGIARGDTPETIKSEPKKYRSYSDLTNELLKEIKEKGIDLFTDE